MLGLFKKRLKPIWQFHKPNGLIWRALFLEPHYLIGEFSRTRCTQSLFLSARYGNREAHLG
ncbi:MAG: hypothetical protein RML35_13990 [Chloroherpetonaceae bacterium]|nr:hypothetical protein [Chloroherpetonaceae bacterium]